MTTQYESSYQSIYYSDNKDIMQAVWHSATEEMEIVIFKKELQIYLEHLQKTQAKKVLIDLRQFMFTIMPEIQTWVDTHIVPIEQTIIQKQAILSPEEFIAELSVEQTMDEANAQELTVEFFQNHDQALNWLNE